MDSLLSNSGRTKSLRNDYLSNYDIQKIYLANEHIKSDAWRKVLYHRVSFLAISRIKKYKIISEKEDLLQSIRLSIWEGIKTFDPHKNFDFYRWISWQINKAVRNFQNSRTRFNSINLLGDSTSNRTFSEDSRCLLLELFGAEAGLSERDKKIIFYYFVEGYTLSEIALKEGLSAEGVRKVCQKSIVKLRKFVNKEI